MTLTHRFSSAALATTLVLALPGAAVAIDGTRLIDQARALAGGLTPGDAAGFPVTISLSGSYRLAGNLVVPDANTSAIVITADNVTLDLNGFAITGPTVCSGLPTVCTPLGTGVGIHGETNVLAVRNGIVRGMGSHGLRLNRPPGTGVSVGHQVSDLQVYGNGGDGIAIGSGVVRQSVVRRNGGRGVALDSGLVSSNTTSQNLLQGVQVFGTAVVTGNNVSDNGGCGITANSGLVSGNNLLQNGTGLCLTAAGYAGNTLISNTVSGGFNLGQNLCAAISGMALCP